MQALQSPPLRTFSTGGILHSTFSTVYHMARPVVSGYIPEGFAVNELYSSWITPTHYTSLLAIGAGAYGTVW